MSLSATERETLNVADRDMLDRAVLAIPSEWEPVFTALLLSTRAVVKHDTASLRSEVNIWPQLLDAADERARELIARGEELIDAAADLRAVADRLEGHVTELRGAIELEATARREGDRLAAERENRHAIAIVALAVTVAILIVEVLNRYGGMGVAGIGGLVLVALLSLMTLRWL